MAIWEMVRISVSQASAVDLAEDPHQCQCTRRCQLAFKLALVTALSPSSAFAVYGLEGLPGSKPLRGFVPTLNATPTDLHINVNKV